MNARSVNRREQEEVGGEHTVMPQPWVQQSHGARVLAREDRGKLEAAATPALSSCQRNYSKA